MNIMDIMRNFRQKQTGEGADEVEKPWAPKHGPQRLRYLTSGQIRRMQAREAATRRRKATEHYRSSFKDRQMQIAVLRGQLQLVGALPYSSGVSHLPPNAKMVEHLNEVYGSVDKALETYQQHLAST